MKLKHIISKVTVTVFVLTLFCLTFYSTYAISQVFLIGNATPDLHSYVTYTGATSNLDLNGKNLSNVYSLYLVESICNSTQFLSTNASTGKVICVNSPMASLAGIYQNVTDLQSANVTTNARIDSLNASSTQYYANISSLQSSNTTTNNRIDSLNSTSNNYYSNISNLQTYQTNSYGNISSLQSSNSTTNNRIDSLNSTSNNYYSNISNLQTYQTNSYGNISSLQSSNSTTNGRIDSLNVTRLTDVISNNSYIVVSGTLNKSLAFQESVLNITISNFIKTILYNVTNITTVTGTPSAGSNVTGVTGYRDGITYNVTEGSGVNPLSIYINFSNVTAFNQIFMREYYMGSGAHEMVLYIWDYNTSTWEDGYWSINGQSNYIDSLITVFDSAIHLSNGTVRLLLNHTQNGIATHRFYLDYIILQQSPVTSTSSGDGTGGWVTNGVNTSTNLGVTTTGTIYENSISLNTKYNDSARIDSLNITKANLAGDNTFNGNQYFIGNITIYNSTQTNYNTSIVLVNGTGETKVNITANGTAYFTGSMAFVLSNGTYNPTGKGGAAGTFTIQGGNGGNNGADFQQAGNGTSVYFVGGKGGDTNSTGGFGIPGFGGNLLFLAGNGGDALPPNDGAMNGGGNVEIRSGSGGNSTSAYSGGNAGNIYLTTGTIGCGIGGYCGDSGGSIYLTATKGYSYNGSIYLNSYGPVYIGNNTGLPPVNKIFTKVVLTGNTNITGNLTVGNTTTGQVAFGNGGGFSWNATDTCMISPANSTNSRSVFCVTKPVG